MILFYCVVLDRLLRFLFVQSMVLEIISQTLLFPFIIISILVYIKLFNRKQYTKSIISFLYLSLFVIPISLTLVPLISTSLCASFLFNILIPGIIYYVYYKVVICKLNKIKDDLHNSNLVIMNVIPITIFLIIAINVMYISYLLNLDNTKMLMQASIILNILIYFIMVLQFVFYYIIFTNIEKHSENIALNNSLLQTQEEVINAFAQVIEECSESTGYHVKRVSEYTRVIAKHLGYSTEEVEKIRIASMLHDVGKMYVPTEILEKPGRLTTEEFDVIKTHVTRGEELLHNINGDLIDLAKKITLQHHEKWDGTGYLNIKGEDIDQISRIVTVADVFDALVSKRSYKDSWPIEKAYDLIVSESGKQFDPIIVDAFVQNFSYIQTVYDSFRDEKLNHDTKVLL